MSADLFSRVRRIMGRHGVVHNVEIVPRPQHGAYTINLEFTKEGDPSSKIFRKHIALVVKPEDAFRAMYQEMLQDGHIDPLAGPPVVTLDPMMDKP